MQASSSRGHSPSGDAGMAARDSSAGVPELVNLKGVSGFFSPMSLLDPSEEDSVAQWNCTVIHTPVHTSDGESPMDLLADAHATHWLHADAKDQINLNDADLMTILSTSSDDDMLDFYVQDPLAASGQLDACYPGVHDTKAHESCTALAHSTLQRLDTPGAQCAALQTTNGVRRSLDTMLKCNQAAVADLLAILDCSCAPSNSQALLATAIISQIFAWYEAGLERSCNPGGLDLLPTPAATNGSNTPQYVNPSFVSGMSTPPLLGHDSVYMPPIMIGGMQLEGEHGGRVVVQVVLVEVMKMNKILDIFGKKFCSASQSCSPDGGTHLHHTLKLHLQNRLRKIIMVARKWLDKS